MILMLSSFAMITPGSTDEDPVPGTTTDRTVIIELFTGATCPPCCNVNIGLEYFMDDHNSSEVVALVYHRNIPARDKLETRDNIDRHRFYVPNGAIMSAPNIFVDGRIPRTGGFNTSAQAQQWFEDNYMSEREASNESQLSMTVDGIFSSTKSGKVWINVTALGTPVESNLTLHTVIVRRSYGPWNSGNGVCMHYWVVRKMLPDPDGEPFNISKDQTRSFSYSFNLSSDPYTIPHDMEFVAFVQSHDRTQVEWDEAYRSRYIAPILQSVCGHSRIVHNFTDRDGDGVPSIEDAFPDDIAAINASDGDGYPDEWNEGMREEDSITHLKLDSYPDDPKRWKEEVESPPVGTMGALVAIGIICGFMRRSRR